MLILIYGSKDFAATAAELIRHCGHQVAGMVDDYNTGPGILGTLETVAHTHPPSTYQIAMAIGYSNIPGRWTAWQRIRSIGYQSPALIHPRAYVADTAKIGQGTMVMAGAIIDVRARIDEIVVVWPGACINHDAEVGENTFVSPNATLCGFTKIGRNSFIGTGAAVVDHCQVPEGAFVKMLNRYVGQ